jgi:hypothetical protein
MEDEEMKDESCSPFEEEDRVDHKIFGFGTVSDAAAPMCGPDINGRDGLRDAGWSIPVRWDGGASLGGYAAIPRRRNVR